MNEDYSQLSNEALRRAYVAAKEKEDAQRADYAAARKELEELERAVEQARRRVQVMSDDMIYIPASTELMQEIQARLDDGRIIGFA